MKLGLIPQAHRIPSVQILASGIVAGLVAGTTVYFNLRDAAPTLVAIGASVLTMALALIARVLRKQGP